jgi:hypothetical protein
MKLKLSANGVQISLFIKTLMSDSEFDIHEEITSTYLEEVGYELGLSRGDTIQICNKMIELGILKVTE